MTIDCPECDEGVISLYIGLDEVTVAEACSRCGFRPSDQQAERMLQRVTERHVDDEPDEDELLRRRYGIDVDDWES